MAFSNGSELIAMFATERCLALASLCIVTCLNRHPYFATHSPDPFLTSRFQFSYIRAMQTPPEL